MSQDRTLEFQSALQSIRSRNPSHPSYAQQQQQQQPLLHQNTPSAFTQQASQLSLRITQTATKLQKLSTLAKRKALFDDRPQEIQALSQSIKNEIQEINAQIGSLQRQEEATTHNGTAKEHTKNVLTSLQSNLAETTTVFGEVLEIRTKTMQDMQKRKREFEFAVQPTVPSYNSPNPGAGGQMQQQLMIEGDQSQYTGARSEAIDSIQEMVGELGQVFTRLSSLLATQGEAVMRIDQNARDIEENVVGAQHQLSRYMETVGSNRWLMMKIFAVLILFIIAWGVFAA